MVLIVKDAERGVDAARPIKLVAILLHFNCFVYFGYLFDYILGICLPIIEVIECGQEEAPCLPINQTLHLTATS